MTWKLVRSDEQTGRFLYTSTSPKLRLQGGIITRLQGGIMTRWSSYFVGPTTCILHGYVKLKLCNIMRGPAKNETL